MRRPGPPIRRWPPAPSTSSTRRIPSSAAPYEFTSRTIGQEIVLTRREDYYMHNGKQVRDKPYFKTIRFRVIQEPGVALLGLKGGEIDEMILTPQQWRTQTNDDDFYKDSTKVYDTEWVSFHFSGTCQSPMFTDKRIRRAMTYAFDHEEMLQQAALRPRSARQRHLPSRLALGTARQADLHQARPRQGRRTARRRRLERHRRRRHSRQDGRRQEDQVRLRRPGRQPPGPHRYLQPAQAEPEGSRHRSHRPPARFRRPPAENAGAQLRGRLRRLGHRHRSRHQREHLGHRARTATTATIPTPRSISCSPQAARSSTTRSARRSIRRSTR